MAECKDCGRWISQRQNDYHHGKCVDHAELDIDYIREQRQNMVTK